MAAELQTEKWYYAKDRRKLGPVTLAQLREMMKQGLLGAEDMVLRHGTGQWTRAAAVVGAANSATQAPPGGAPVEEVTVAAEMPTLQPGAACVAPAAGFPSVPGFTILDELGRGGMGVVYRAEQIKLKRLVALKMILGGAVAGSQQVQRFRAEAEAVARLQHPNIVQVYEVGEYDGLPFFALEFCSGGCLAERLDGTPLDARAAAVLVETMARALQAAHERGIIHRDLKPANVLFTADGVLKITDFGLAKKLDDTAVLTQTGAVMGTPSYMAPEQAFGKTRELGAAADVYALGAVLYELLTGRPPFKATTALETIMQVAVDEPVPPSQLRPKLPRDLETVCLKCLEKSAARRYASAKALADDLRRFLDGDAITARPVSGGERTWRWCNRHRGLTAAALLTAFGLVAVVVVSLLFGIQQARVAIREKQSAQRESAAALREAKTADDLRAEQEETKRHLNESRRLTALYMWERGHNLCERGDSENQADGASGLHWMVRALETTPDDAPELRVALRRSLAAWRGESCGLRTQIPLRPGGRAVFSGDGRAILTNEPNPKGGRELSRWDATTGELLDQPTFPDETLRPRAWHPDGKHILTVDGDNVARLWDPARSVLEGQPLPHPAPIIKVVFSHDGKTLVTECKDRTIRVWDVAAAKTPDAPIRIGVAVKAFAFSGNNQALAILSVDNAIQFYDLKTGRSLNKVIRVPGDVPALALSPDGRTLVTAGEASSKWEPQVWDVEKSQALGDFQGHQGGQTAVALSSDGRTLLTTSGDKSARLWDIATRQQIGSPVWHGSWVEGGSFSPDGRTFLTIADNRVRVWNVPRANRLAGPALRHDSQVTCVAYNRDGQLLATGSLDQKVRLWETKTSHLSGLPLPHAYPVKTIAFTPDGRQLLVAGGPSAQLWDVQTRKPWGKPFPESYPILGVAFNADGSQVVLASYSPQPDYKSRVRRYETATQRLLKEILDPGTLSGVAWNPDGRTIVTSQWQMAKVWDADSGQLLHTGFDTPRFVAAVAISPDGKKILTGHHNWTAQVWDAATFQPIGRPLVMKSQVETVAFSSDSTLMATAGLDRTARLWDAHSNNPIGPLYRHPDTVLAIAFSPDGKTLATGAVDNFARRWVIPAPMERPTDQVALWARVFTGTDMDHDGGVRFLDIETWRQERRRFMELVAARP